MGELIEKTRCPKCAERGRDNSGDNLAVYDDGSTYCFSCHAYNWAEKKVENNSQFITGTHKALPNRGISLDVCKFYDYQVGRNKHGEPVHICNIYDGGEKIAQKIRKKDKKFQVIGDGKNLGLIGTQLWEPNPNTFVIITEGEIDMLSVAEVQGTRFPVVSLPNGASSAAAAIKKDLRWLSKWKYVALGFDNDEAGREAVKSCQHLFEPGKVRVITWKRKDPNEMLLEGESKEITNCIFNAASTRPDNLLTPSQLKERVLSKPIAGVPWPWQELTDMTGGCREGQLIAMAAGPGIGKTTVAYNMIEHVINSHGLPSAVFSFEHEPEDSLRTLIGIKHNVHFNLPEDMWDPEVLEQGIEELEGKLQIYDNMGNLSIEHIVSLIRYSAKADGVKLFLIDNLTPLSAKMDGDERRGIDKAMQLLQSLTKELKCSIILICHLSKDSGKDGGSWGQGREPSGENFRGSMSISALSDVVLGLSRSADSEEEVDRNILKVKCLKSKCSRKARGTSFKLKYVHGESRLQVDDGFMEYPE